MLTLSDRLPAVSASQALQQLRNERPFSISTGVPKLDTILVGQSPGGNGGGLVRGQITEVFGPSGVGKTAFACVSPVQDGNVQWVNVPKVTNGSFGNERWGACGLDRSDFHCPQRIWNPN